MIRKVVLATSIVFLVLGTLGLTWVWNTHPRLIRVEAPIPEEFPPDGFSHAVLERLLREFVDDDGRVDYGRWHADAEARQLLDSHLAAVAAYSPDNAPGRFASDNDRLAYWLYTYNALVIKAVLEYWPLESVTDVKAPLEVVKGLGFFYTIEFVVGGRRLTLYALEHEKIPATSQDPRVHFVLNCGSGGCPALRPELPTGKALEPYLASAARDFVASERNVRVDDENREVTLSSIFQWYEKEFLNDLRRRGSSGTLLDYIALVGPEETREKIKAAEGYTIAFAEYDWSINSARP